MGNIPDPVNLEMISQCLSDALFVVDCSKKVVWMNRGAEEIFGVKLESEKGSPLVEITGLNRITSLLEEVLNSGEPVECSYENATVKVKSLDQRYFFKITINPIGQGDQFEGALVQLTDVTRFQEMEKIKSGFVSIVSHEFRTPLTTIIIGVEMLREGLLGDLTPRGKEVLDAIGADCGRLTRLIDNLLELSRIEAGTIYVEAEPVDVNELVGEAVRPLKIQAESKDVELIADLPPHIPPVAADFNKAVWILTNLIGNALRYTDAGGSITVRVRKKGNRIFFSVEDSGCGIPKEYLDKIFRKYIQVRGQEKVKGGAGLGLAIAKDIVLAHGGEIWAESEEGQGSTFTFTFPLYRKEENIDIPGECNDRIEGG